VKGGTSRTHQQGDPGTAQRNPSQQGTTLPCRRRGAPNGCARGVHVNRCSEFRDRRVSTYANERSFTLKGGLYEETDSKDRGEKKSYKSSPLKEKSSQAGKKIPSRTYEKNASTGPGLFSGKTCRKRVGRREINIPPRNIETIRYHKSGLEREG